MSTTEPSTFIDALYLLVKTAHEQNHDVDAVMEILREQGIIDKRFRVIVEEMFKKYIVD